MREDAHLSDEPPGAVTIDGIRFLYRPALHFVVVGLVAACMALLVFLASDDAPGSPIRPEQLVLALVTTGVFAGLAASALATARAAFLPLLLGSLLTLAVYDSQDLYASTIYAASLLSAMLVAWALAALSPELVDAPDDPALRRQIRRRAVGLAAVLGIAIPLLTLQPEPVSGFMASNHLRKPTSIVLTLVIYAGIGLASAALLRWSWWRRPAPGALVALTGAGLAWLAFVPTLCMWYGVATGQYLVNSDMDVGDLLGPTGHWYALALSAAFLYFCALYLVGSWRRAYPPSPEQTRQAQQALGIVGLLGLMFGAAYLKGAPERRRRAEARQRQQEREWQQVIDGMNASASRGRPAQPARAAQRRATPAPPAPAAPAALAPWELEQRRDAERERRLAEEQAELERRQQEAKQDRFMRATLDDERKAEDQAQRQRDLQDG